MFSIDKAGEVMFVDLPQNPVVAGLVILGALAVGKLSRRQLKVE